MLAVAGGGEESRAERTGADGRLLECDAIVDEADVLGGLQRARALASEQVQHACAQHHVLAVLDELAQRQQCCRQWQRQSNFL